MSISRYFYKIFVVPGLQSDRDLASLYPDGSSVADIIDLERSEDQVNSLLHYDSDVVGFSDTVPSLDTLDGYLLSCDDVDCNYLYPNSNMFVVSMFAWEKPEDCSVEDFEVLIDCGLLSLDGARLVHIVSVYQFGSREEGLKLLNAALSEYGLDEGVCENGREKRKVEVVVAVSNEKHGYGILIDGPYNDFDDDEGRFPDGSMGVIGGELDAVCNLFDFRPDYWLSSVCDAIDDLPVGLYRIGIPVERTPVDLSNHMDSEYAEDGQKWWYTVNGSIEITPIWTPGKDE